MSGAERRLNERGITIGEFDFGREDEPDVSGFAMIEELPESSSRIVLLVRPGTASEIRAMFAEWAEQRLARFFEHGPEPDGWQRRSDGAWQLWTRLVELPPLD